MNSKRPLLLCTLAAQFLLAGCARTPSIDIFGSFFPVWMACIGGGIAVTLLLRHLLVFAGLDKAMGPRTLIYSCMAFLFSCVIWMVGFHD
jgi:hypothetical protein